jgi:hypothetical protein
VGTDLIEQLLAEFVEKVECNDEDRRRLLSWQIIVGSTAKKWSVHFKGEAVFDRNHTSLGMFVFELCRHIWRRIRELLAEELVNGTTQTAVRQEVLLRFCRFEKTLDSEGWTGKDNTPVDEAVCDTNRLLRCPGCKKMTLKAGKDRPALVIRKPHGWDFLYWHDFANLLRLGFKGWENTLVSFLPTCDENIVTPLRMEVRSH